MTEANQDGVAMVVREGKYEAGSPLFVLRTRDGVPRVVRCVVVGIGMRSVSFGVENTVVLNGDIVSSDEVISTGRTVEELLQKIRTDCSALLADAQLHVDRIDDVARIERLSMFLRDWM